MKKVLIKTKKYSYKDLGQFLKIFFINTIIICIYTLIFLGLNYLIQKEFLIVSWSIIYPLGIAIPINAILSIIYIETGSLIMRFITVIHTFVIIILVPLFIFI